MSGAFRIQLPASSANLGSGFDAVAVALGFHLTIEAEPAPASNPAFSIEATGRDADRCARLEDNLLLDLYREILTREGRPVVPLAIRMQNEIPLGMGCGSSAAGRLAAIALAVHFGRLGWPSDSILAEAAKIEGHPDNVAACWLGGFVASSNSTGRLQLARVEPPSDWRAIVVVPSEPLATSKARAVLPDSFPRADVVANLQSATLLALAFAQGRGELLAVAMSDRIHQPYREAICPMLPRILPLASQSGILGAALSGAGPSVLVIVDKESNLKPASEAIHAALTGLPPAELLITGFQNAGTYLDTP